MREYLKYRIWDWLLCSCIAVGVVFPLYAGFVLEDGFSQSVWRTAVFMAAVTAVLVLLSRSRVTIGIGIAVGAALLVFVMVYVRINSVSIFGEAGAETTNSLFVALTVASLTVILVYLAGRTRGGIIALFLVGTILICGSYFLQYESHVWSLLLFLFCTIVLYWYRNYLSTLQQAQAGKIRMPRFMAQSLVVCLIAVALGSAAWYGIVRPLEPPTRELKLIQQLKQQTVVQRSGIYSTQTYLDPNLASSEDTDEREDGTQNENDQTPEDTDEETNSEPQTGQQDQSPAEQAQPIYYLLNYYNIPWILVAVAAVIAAAFILRMLARKNWENRVIRMTPEQQILTYYPWFLTRLERTGMKRPQNHTLYEYAEDMDHTLSEFADGEADFSTLTDLYVKCFYGGTPADDGEAELFRRFYGKFHRALRKEIGTFRYLIHIFRI